MTEYEYRHAVTQVLVQHTQEAVSRLEAVMRQIPSQARELTIDIHVDQDGEGFLGVRVSLDGPDLYVLNKHIEENAQLFETKMTSSGLNPPLPLMEPNEEDFSVQYVLTDIGVEWVSTVWKKIDQSRYDRPASIVSPEGYGSSVPVRLK